MSVHERHMSVLITGMAGILYLVPATKKNEILQITMPSAEFHIKRMDVTIVS